MKNVRVRVVEASGSTCDTTVGKIYEGVYLDTGELQFYPPVAVNAPMLSFIDDIGDRLYTYVTTNHVEIIEGEE